MTSRDFCYWLQGFFEIQGIDPSWGIPADKAEIIKRHLSLVFAHEIDPQAGGPDVQAKLNAIHSPPNVLAFDKDTKMRC